VEFINTILTGDCIEKMASLPDGCVNCCITSPPYYGLRDYGVDGQIGLEESPEAYVSKMVEVFRSVKRLLGDDGTLWLNLGDSYWGGGWRGADLNENSGDVQKGHKGTHCGATMPEMKGKNGIYKPKDLVGIPWMVAFALRADGWYLRQDIIWHKPNPMPESVTDRCTKAHEYIFLMSKSQRYYYDADAIKDDAVDEESYNGRRFRGPKSIYLNNAIPAKMNHQSFDKKNNELQGKTYEKVNKRSVWTVTTRPFGEAHFATFPERLIVDMIKAGCPEGGVVLDPFMGAGTTALVARKLNRNYVGVELNSSYVEIANKRLYNELGMYL
jgi:DNA modification methylase